MIKKWIAVFSIMISTNAFAAAPVVYQAKTIVALFSDSNVINSLPGGYIVDVKYRSDLSPFSYDIISGDYAKAKVCTTPVTMKISNSDDWNPAYSVDKIGATTCK